jgi:hypothetical protein
MLRLSALVCLTFCILTQATAQPIFTIGIIATRGMSEDIVSFMNGTFNVDVYQEMYWGIGGDLMIDFTKWFTLRFELCDFKFLDRGGTNLEMLSNINTDAIFFIPIGRRIAPLVYVGFQFGRFWNTEPQDYRSFDPVYEVRAGLGTQYRLSGKYAILIEIEMYNKSQSKMIRIPIEDMIYNYQIESFGVNSINLGTRISL